MNLLANTTVLLGKELRTEFRSRELLTTTVVFISSTIPRRPNPHSARRTASRPLRAVFSLGGFRTPADESAVPSFKRPASETLHKSGKAGSEQRSSALRSKADVALRLSAVLQRVKHRLHIVQFQFAAVVLFQGV